jgi:hypothetical protein
MAQIDALLEPANKVARRELEVDLGDTQAVKDKEPWRPLP